MRTTLAGLLIGAFVTTFSLSVNADESWSTETGILGWERDIGETAVLLLSAEAGYVLRMYAPGLAQDVDGGRATYHGYWVANSGEVACPVQLIDPLGQATWYWGTFTMSFVHETFPSDWAGTTGDCFEPQNGTISGLSRD